MADGLKLPLLIHYEDRSGMHGVDKTDWIKISRAEYDACIDPTDYRSVVYNQCTKFFPGRIDEQNKTL